MSMTVEKPSVATPVRAKSSRAAWLALLTTVILEPIGLGIGLTNQGWWTDLAFGFAILVPPAAAVVFGVRAAQTGNRLAALATGIGAGWLTCVLAFYLGANFLFTGSNDSVPGAIAVTMGLIVGGTVDWWFIHQRRPIPPR